MMSSIIKDAGEIWSRLFDHRPFLSGEIQYFLKEFEEKRSDREVENLFKTLETVSEIKDNQIDKSASAGKELQDLKSQLDVAIDRCDNIIENQSQYDTAKALEVKRELRKTEWEAFVVDMDAKFQKVDETFADKENELKEFYCDLERKLHLTSD